jgi:hypothetical protein
MITQKNHQKIAIVIREEEWYGLQQLNPGNGHYAAGYQRACRNMAEALAKYFAADSPAFKREDFLAASVP